MVQKMLPSMSNFLITCISQELIDYPSNAWISTFPTPKEISHLIPFPKSYWKHPRGFQLHDGGAVGQHWGGPGLSRRFQKRLGCESWLRRGGAGMTTPCSLESSSSPNTAT